MRNERVKPGPSGAAERSVVILLCVSLAAGLFACGGGETPVREFELKRAQALLVPFKSELQAALGEGLAGGAENAIDVCRYKAPEIAAALSTGGVTMGRTSHRLRNRRNAPESWVEPLLAAYLGDPDDSTPRAVRLDDGSVGYVEPIYVQPVCLTCHGPDISPSVADRLDAVYPGDNGRGFAEGEFRGLFWVKLPPSR